MESVISKTTGAQNVYFQENLKNASKHTILLLVYFQGITDKYVIF